MKKEICAKEGRVRDIFYEVRWWWALEDKTESETFTTLEDALEFLDKRVPKNSLYQIREVKVIRFGGL